MQREPCRYLIVPLAGPFFPYNCAVSNQSDSTLSIRCDGSIAANNTSSSSSSSESADNPNFRTAANTAEQDDPEEDGGAEGEAEEETDQRIKYHPQKSRRKFAEPHPSSNLSTADIYALYFAPDSESLQQQTDEDVDSDSGQRANGKNKLTYRNGGPLGSSSIIPEKMSQHHLTASANLLLNELVPKFNSYSINSSPHLFAYPPTYYVCEIYAMMPRMTLIKVRIL